MRVFKYRFARIVTALLLAIITSLVIINVTLQSEKPVNLTRTMDYQMASNQLSPDCSPRYDETWLAREWAGFPFRSSHTLNTYDNPCANYVERGIIDKLAYSANIWALVSREGLANLVIYFVLWFGLIELLWRRHENPRY